MGPLERDVFAPRTQSKGPRIWEQRLIYLVAFDRVDPEAKNIRVRGLGVSRGCLTAQGPVGAGGREPPQPGVLFCSPLTAQNTVGFILNFASFFLIHKEELAILDKLGNTMCLGEQIYCPVIFQ